MSSRAKQVIKIEGDVAKQRPRSVYSSKSSTNKDVKRSVTNGKEVELGKAAHLPLDSLCLIVGKLEFVKDIVTCALVCRHWKDAAFCDVVSVHHPLLEPVCILRPRAVRAGSVQASEVDRWQVLHFILHSSKEV